jgi:hypothetical protein
MADFGNSISVESRQIRANGVRTETHTVATKAGLHATISHLSSNALRLDMTQGRYDLARMT